MGIFVNFPIIFDQKSSDIWLERWESPHLTATTEKWNRGNFN